MFIDIINHEGKDENRIPSEFIHSFRGFEPTFSI